MRAPLRLLYRGATALANVAVQFAPDKSSKLSRTFRARRGLIDRVRAGAASVRDVRRPLLWLHAPSVGEGLQARPVAHQWRTMHPNWQIAYTFFSPSAEAFASSINADITEYLPFDSVSHADAMLDVLRPTMLVFAKLDVWPILVERAVRRGIPVALISATLAESSGRRSWWSRQLLRDAYASLNRVGVIDEQNATRLMDLGVPRSAIEVTGDTRFDQVTARASSVDRQSALLAPLASSRPTLVAGSTWPSDEAELLSAWAAMMHQSPSSTAKPRLIIAPHEPTPEHCTPIVDWATRHGLRLRRLSEGVAAAANESANESTNESANESAEESADTVDVLLVDRVGVLGELYALADVAYVGGGFHRAGLHSVIEPAAFGVPVLFGPRHQMSREAALLLSAGAARAVDAAPDLVKQLRVWLSDAPQRQIAGRASRTVVDAERGATMRTVALLERVLATAKKI